MNAKAKEVVEEVEEDTFDLSNFLDTIGEAGEVIMPITLYNGDVEEVKIYRVTTLQLYNIIDLLKGVIQTMEIKSFTELADIKNLAGEPDKAMVILMENFDRAVRVIEGLCSLEISAVRSLEVDQLIALISAEWRVNENFFTTRVVKLLESLLPQKSDTEQ